MQDLDDKIAIGFRKAVTRRTLIQRCMRWSLAAGTAMSMSLKFAADAEASNCSRYGVRSDWGCYCAPTQSCQSTICNSGNVAANHKRCNAWPLQNSAGQYCWCSQSCVHTPGILAHYVCCDGWREERSGCNDGYLRTPCICRWFFAE